MPKVLVLGLLTAAAIAGTVFAARSENASPVEAAKQSAAKGEREATWPNDKGTNVPHGLKRPSTEDVLKLWTPQLKSAIDFQWLGGEPKRSGVAAYSFKVVGPTFEELWNHYAKLCGVPKKYQEGTFLVSADTGPNGAFVVAEQWLPATDGTAKRGPSMFVLKTDAYTVTVTFQPAPDGKSIVGSISLVLL